METEENECQHDETDHGYCLDCGEDRTDALIAKAEAWSDSLDDR
jgi:hypothetical protein